MSVVAQDRRLLAVVPSVLDRYNLSGEPRFDQSFVDWLKGKPYPVIDMRDVFAADYRKYRIDVDQYLAPFYNGHHTPKDNFFTAWASRTR